MGIKIYVYSQVITDSKESECETCVGQSFGPRDDGYNSMIDCVMEDQVTESEGQMQPLNESIRNCNDVVYSIYCRPQENYH